MFGIFLGDGSGHKPHPQWGHISHEGGNNLLLSLHPFMHHAERGFLFFFSLHDTTFSSPCASSSPNILHIYCPTHTLPSVLLSVFQLEVGFQGRFPAYFYIRGTPVWTSYIPESSSSNLYTLLSVVPFHILAILLFSSLTDMVSVCPWYSSQTYTSHVEARPDSHHRHSYHSMSFAPLGSPPHAQTNLSAYTQQPSLYPLDISQTANYVYSMHSSSPDGSLYGENGEYPSSSSKALGRKASRSTLLGRAVRRSLSYGAATSTSEEASDYKEHRTSRHRRKSSALDDKWSDDVKAAFIDGKDYYRTSFEWIGWMSNNGYSLYGCPEDW